MMLFFDYIFFRTYIAFKNRGEEQVIGPSIHVGNCIGGFIFPIWWGAYHIIIIDNKPPKMYAYTIAIFVYTWLYIRYKKKKEQIIRKYIDSKYNKIIPIFLIYFMVVVCAVLGFLLTYLLERYIFEPFHLKGILGKWLNL